ncbi:MAG: hypothetical protein GKC53_02575 [Neisseriaceae bacterium]|nr:MAG: hypothetical protein GKC53_02575 [Neisseriaceae bacterium]
MLYLFRNLTFTLIILVNSVSFTKTFVCIDKSGNKTYTDKANLNTCSVSELGVLNTYSADLSIKAKNTKITKANGQLRKVNNHENNPTDSDIIISKQTQSKRDATRKQILNNELKNEIQALVDIRGKMKDAHSENNLSIIHQLEQQANEHQQNIDVISKELSRI